MRATRLVLFVGGAALFAGLLIQIGPATLRSTFAHSSWSLPVVLVFPFCLMITLEALGWRFAFRYDRVPFTALLSRWLAGEAFNVITPTATVGGEAVKAWLIRPYLPMTESLPSLIIAKTTTTIGQVLFLLVGTIVAWTTLAEGSALIRLMEWIVGFECAGVAGFVAVQILGVTGGAGRALQRFGCFGKREGGRFLSAVDRELGRFYRHEPYRLIFSITCQFSVWVLGVLETYLILWALGIPVSLATATVIEAVGAGVNFAAFFIPGRLGAAEGGDVALFLALGLGAPAGLALSLIRRLREVVWIGIGILVFLRLGAPASSPVRLGAEV